MAQTLHVMDLTPRTFSPLLLSVCTVFFFFIYRYISATFPIYFLPKRAAEEHTKKIQAYKRLHGIYKNVKGNGGNLDKEKQKDFEKYMDLRIYYISSRANATAALHALIATPLAFASSLLTTLAGLNELPPLKQDCSAYEYLYHYLFAWGDTQAFWSVYLPVQQLLANFMCGYFIWDLYECIHNRDVHHILFTMHAVISVLVTQTSTLPLQDKVTGLAAFLALSELSTPLIHYRWFIVKNGYAHTLRFKIINFTCVFLFVFYRLIFMPFFIFSHLFTDLYFRKFSRNINNIRLGFVAFVAVMWSFLNIMWTRMFFQSLFKKRNCKTE